MNFKLLPADVARVMSGHYQRLLPAPGGSGELLSPLDVANHKCFELEVDSHGRFVCDQEMLRGRYRHPKYDVMSCPRELKPELLIREIDPETGEVLSEQVWNDRAFLFLDEDGEKMRKPAWNKLLKERMRVRGPRKQISARAARQLEVLNSEVIDELAKAAEGIFTRRRMHDVDDLHPVKQFQGYRTTNLKTGEKYSGTQKDIREAQAKRALDRGELSPTPKAVGEGVPKMDDEKLSRMVARAKEIFGL